VAASSPRLAQRPRACISRSRRRRRLPPRETLPLLSRSRCAVLNLTRRSGRLRTPRAAVASVGPPQGHHHLRRRPPATSAYSASWNPRPHLRAAPAAVSPPPRALEGVRHRLQRGAPTGASELARTVKTMVDCLKLWNQVQRQAAVGRAIHERPWWLARSPGGHLESVALRLFGWAVGAARATPRRAGQQVWVIGS